MIKSSYMFSKSLDIMSWLDYLRGQPKTPAPAPSTQATIQEPRLLDASASTSLPKPPTTQDVPPSRTQDLLPAPPKNRSALLFGAGVTFFAFSVLVSRRSFARRNTAINLAAMGKPVPQVSPALEAVEALNIATINVVSVAMMASGGALWYFKINSLEDARRLIRGGLGVDGTGRSESNAEEELQEWMATVMSRREEKEKVKAKTEDGKNGVYIHDEMGRKR